MFNDIIYFLFEMDLNVIKQKRKTSEEYGSCEGLRRGVLKQADVKSDILFYRISTSFSFMYIYIYIICYTNTQYQYLTILSTLHWTIYTHCHADRVIALLGHSLVMLYSIQINNTNNNVGWADELYLFFNNYHP